MRVVVFACLVACASATLEVPKYYHTEIGIPLAEKIKAAEDEYFSNRSGLKIVGGVSAAPNAHPYLGGLLVSFSNIAGRGACGSTLLSPNRLVTAAHCWRDGVNTGIMFEVVLGSNFLFYGGTRISTSSVVMHPQWQPATLRNDIAMILLPYNVLFSQLISPANLPTGADVSNMFAGEWAMAAGFGKTTDLLPGITQDASVREVNIQVITNLVCQLSYGVVFVQPSTICTSGSGFVGVCGGDSGGPLVIIRNGEPTLIGVTSFAANNACHMGHPSGFARVTSFLSFINQYLQ